jgi:YfiH family protein
MHADWLIPQWPAPASVRAVCTTRAGGVSAAPYASLNLGTHVGDDPQAVASNRQELSRAVAARPVFLQQVHGVDVVCLDAVTADGLMADGCVTAQRHLACTIMVADCLPVLMTTLSGEVVGAAHAGWRGLAGGVLEATLQQLWQQSSASAAAATASETLVWFGPCIGAQNFEVGAEVRAAFVAQQSQAQACFTSLGQDKFLADLQGLARQRLQALGVSHIYGNDGSVDWCTVSQAPKYFSHRRDRVSGRMAACVWRE